MDTYKLFTGLGNYGIMKDLAGQSTVLIASSDDAMADDATINEDSNV